MNNSNRVLVACMPKSGSTYLTAILSNLPGFLVTSWVPDYGRREQELCYLRLQNDKESLPNHNMVAQHHVRYSDVTKRYIEEFSLKPVVLVRGIYDVIPSLIDHHRAESVVYPMAYAPAGIVGWDNVRAEKFVSYMVIPWYFNFYASWVECSNKLMVTYDGLIANPLDTVKGICEYHKIEATTKEIGIAVECVKSMKTRKNVGISGRGAGISDQCKRHIMEMASFYDDLDFSMIGI